MKNIIWVFMLFISCSNINGQHTNIRLMRFQYIGESDKPIPSLLITTDKSQLKKEPWVESILVSEKTLYFIEEFIKKNSTNIHQKDSFKMLENIAFKIDIDNNELGLIKRRESFLLFTQLKNEIKIERNIDYKDAESINLYLDRVLPRIDW